MKTLGIFMFLLAGMCYNGLFFSKDPTKHPKPIARINRPTKKIVTE